MTIALSTSRNLRLCASSLTLMATLFTAQQAAAHGYMNSPPSRAYACQQGLNIDCGQAQYEPQSVGEAPKGFPEFGPADGKIASGGHASFAALDAQSANRWHVTEIKDHTTEFSWFYTAAHKSTRWQYFITKGGWNPNLPISRDSFELTPFCQVEGGGGIPIDGAEGGTGQGKDKHSCSIPSDRSGHHLILGVWTIDDTAAAFYDVVDVNITAQSADPDGWKNVGSISQTQTLQPGDSVKARAFTGSSESAEYSFGVTIEKPEEGQPANWSYKLAETVNAANKPLVRAGVRNENGGIEPIKGANTLYAKAESGVTRYEMQTVMVPDPGAYLHLHDVAPEYVLEKGKGTVGFTVMTNKNVTLEATVFNATHKQVGYTKQTVSATTAPVSIAVLSAPGEHSLKLIATSQDGRENFQDLKSINLTGEGGAQEYDFVFPEGIAGYKAGTLVLQPKNDKVYECQPFPNSGYCIQYSPSANGFEPGIGASWDMAWTEK